MNNFKPGDKVTYVNRDKRKNGFVKSVTSKHAFVSYYFENNLKNHEDSIGIKTNLKYLIEGWWQWEVVEIMHYGCVASGFLRIFERWTCPGCGDEYECYYDEKAGKLNTRIINKRNKYEMIANG